MFISSSFGIFIVLPEVSNLLLFKNIAFGLFPLVNIFWFPVPFIVIVISVIDISLLILIFDEL